MVTRVGMFSTGWGESLVWDEQRQRLYFVDCAAATVHWLDEATTSCTRCRRRLCRRVWCRRPTGGSSPSCRTASTCSTPTLGRSTTGKPNLGPGEGSAWWFSASEGWRLVDDDITNTNGPAVADMDGEMTLIIGDTSGLAGGPDGATLDDRGGLWCALFGGRQLARFTSAGLDSSITVPVENPTDVSFGGPGLDRL